MNIYKEGRRGGGLEAVSVVLAEIMDDLFLKKEEWKMSVMQAVTKKSEGVERAAQAVREAVASRDRAKVSLLEIRAKRDEMAAAVAALSTRVDEIESARAGLIEEVAASKKPVAALDEQRVAIQDATKAHLDRTDLLQAIEQTVKRAETDLAQHEGKLRDSKQRFYRNLGAEMRANIPKDTEIFLHKYWVAAEGASGGMAIWSILNTIIKTPDRETLRAARVEIEQEYF